jgi:hypothetical protein
MDRRRNSARAYKFLKVFVCVACGFRLAGSQDDERRFRANARLALTGGAKQKSSDS